MNFPPTIAEALLHDTREDTETTPDEFRQAFGEAVASIVGEVSDDKSLPKAERKRLRVKPALHASAQAKLVKLADKICNVHDLLGSPPAGWSLARRQPYFDWAAEVVAGVRDVHPGLAAMFDCFYARRPS